MLILYLYIFSSSKKEKKNKDQERHKKNELNEKHRKLSSTDFLFLLLCFPMKNEHKKLFILNVLRWQRIKLDNKLPFLIFNYYPEPQHFLAINQACIWSLEA